LENEEISGGTVLHNTCSPQFHALISSFHIEIQHGWLAVSFMLLNFNTLTSGLNQSVCAKTTGSQKTEFCYCQWNECLSRSCSTYR